MGNPLTCPALAGPKHLIDEKTAGDLMLLLLHPEHQIRSVSQDPRKYDRKLKPKEAVGWAVGVHMRYPRSIPKIYFRNRE